MPPMTDAELLRACAIARRGDCPDVMQDIEELPAEIESDHRHARELWERAQWQPIDTAPKDGTNIDLWAKRWRADNDGFFYRRFPECYWTNGDSMTNRRGSWVHLEDGWYPTHWRPEPEPPK